MYNAATMLCLTLLYQIASSVPAPCEGKTRTDIRCMHVYAYVGVVVYVCMCVYVWWMLSFDKERESLGRSVRYMICRCTEGEWNVSRVRSSEIAGAWMT